MRWKKKNNVRKQNETKFSLLSSTLSFQHWHMTTILFDLYQNMSNFANWSSACFAIIRLKMSTPMLWAIQTLTNHHQSRNTRQNWLQINNYSLSLPTLHCQPLFIRIDRWKSRLIVVKLYTLPHYFNKYLSQHCFDLSLYTTLGNSYGKNTINRYWQSLINMQIFEHRLFIIYYFTCNSMTTIIIESSIQMH